MPLGWNLGYGTGLQNLVAREVDERRLRDRIRREVEQALREIAPGAEPGALLNRIVDIRTLRPGGPEIIQATVRFRADRGVTLDTNGGVREWASTEGTFATPVAAETWRQEYMAAFPPRDGGFFTQAIPLQSSGPTISIDEIRTRRFNLIDRARTGPPPPPYVPHPFVQAVLKKKLPSGLLVRPPIPVITLRVRVQELRSRWDRLRTRPGLVNRNDIIVGYIEAGGRIMDAGYFDDIEWARKLAYVKPDAEYILCEGSWVIVNSGFRAAVAKKLWPRLRAAFHEFELEKVTADCLPEALSVLRHERKMKAIVALADILRTEGVERILADAKDPPRLTRLPYVGKVTCWHLAKVLGIDCVKPDVHLVRAAKAAGYDTPLALCEMLRDASGDCLTVVDTILWRYGEQQLKRQWPSWEELFTRDAS